MSNFPSISVVTPTLNQVQFIAKTVDSVLDQDYPNLEYLVIDGGSTDGTQEVLVSFGSRISWRVEEKVGQSEAINQGWSMTGGEILAWINSDDFYSSGTFRKVGEYFMLHPEIDMVYGECDYVGVEGEFLRNYPTREFSYPDLVLATENFIPQPTVFFRRTLLENVGFLDESLHFVMDFDFWLRIGLSHNVGFIKKKLASMRLHQEAKSVADLKMFAAELVKIYDKVYSIENLPDEILEVKQEAMSNIYFRAADCAYWGKDFSSARNFARTSRKFDQRKIRGLWFWIVLGRLGGMVTDRIYKNPYTS